MAPKTVPVYEESCDTLNQTDVIKKVKNAYPLLAHQKVQYQLAANQLKQRVNNMSEYLSSSSSPCAARYIELVAKKFGIYNEVNNTIESEWFDLLKGKYLSVASEIIKDINDSLEDSSFIMASKGIGGADAQTCAIKTGTKDYRIELDQSRLSNVEWSNDASLDLGHEFAHAVIKMVHEGEKKVGYEDSDEYNQRIVNLFIVRKDDKMSADVTFRDMIDNPYFFEHMLELAGDEPCA